MVSKISLRILVGTLAALFPLAVSASVQSALQHSLSSESPRERSRRSCKELDSLDLDECVTTLQERLFDIPPNSKQPCPFLRRIEKEGRTRPKDLNKEVRETLQSAWQDNSESAKSGPQSRTRTASRPLHAVSDILGNAFKDHNTPLPSLSSGSIHLLFNVTRWSPPVAFDLLIRVRPDALAAVAPTTLATLIAELTAEVNMQVLASPKILARGVVGAEEMLTGRSGTGVHKEPAADEAVVDEEHRVPSSPDILDQKAPAERYTSVRVDINAALAYQAPNMSAQQQTAAEMGEPSGWNPTHLGPYHMPTELQATSGLLRLPYLQRRALEVTEQVAECCEEVLDSNSTCGTSSRLYGDYSSGDAGQCANFCQEQFSSEAVTHVDFWWNILWCNCYTSCNTTRCVSSSCIGAEGGNVSTLKFLAKAPNSPPAPPNPSNPPMLPITPPLRTSTNGTVANISHEQEVYAGDQLGEAIQSGTVEIVYVYSRVVSLKYDSLPNISRPFSILGLCDTEEDGSLCEISSQQLYRIFTVVQGGALELEGLALRGGWSATNGGALYLATGTNATLRSCLLEGNVAELSGGAVYMDSRSSLVLEATLLLGNSAFDSRPDSRGGGGIFGSQETLIVIRAGSQLVNNSAEAGKGGALVALGASKVTITEGSEISGNRAADHGGGVYIYMADIDVYHSTFANNTSGNYGGGIMCSQECGINLGNASKVVGNTALGRGGGLYGHSNTECDVGPGADVSYNRAHLMEGGGIYMYNNNKLAVRASKIAHNTAESGGGIYTVDADSVTMDQGSTVEYNNAVQDGGGICSFGKTPIRIVQGSNVHGNFAGRNGAAIVITASGGEAAEEYGGNNTSILLTISNSNLSHNTAYVDGGAVHMSGVNNIAVVISGSDLVHNTARYSGGVVWASGSGNSITFSKSNLSYNTAQAESTVATLSANLVLGEDARTARGLEVLLRLRLRVRVRARSAGGEAVGMAGGGVQGVGVRNGGGGKQSTGLMQQVWEGL
ncbi:hypothetical protein CYMTET_21916 [Cymbomonas tetramitiformis]|uniref:Right handed beta helix domain-containing protein n=1 Tax=Cymbomonas tetramitiformis TaxID=36881 RepID=A0AAE0G167_9CHLO|nr:hypothetical protein CYMTET_21916 [Cymbomonas tetramitiformis]